MTTRYRFNRRGEVVPDTRTMTDAYVDPVGQRYKRGAPLFAQRSSSPARELFKAERVARREAARTAAQRAMQAVHEAATR